MARALIVDDKTFTVLDSEVMPGGDPDTSYTLRQITREKRNEIVTKNTKNVPNPFTQRMERQVDQDGIVYDVLDYVLVGWSGIVADGQPVPCERRYKLMLDDQIAGRLVGRAGLTQIVAAEVARHESFPATA